MRPFPRLMLVICLLTLACQRRSTVKELSDDGQNAKPPLDVRNVQQVRGALSAIDQDKKAKKQWHYLISVEERAFPAYEAILSDPRASYLEVANVFGILCNVKADRRCFIRHVFYRFTDSDYGVRSSALRLLERIGSPAESSPVIALLSDEHTEVGYAAAKTLAAIGGPNEVVAMDVWLRGITYREDRQLREHVQKCRDALKKRLAEKKDPTK